MERSHSLADTPPRDIAIAVLAVVVPVLTALWFPVFMSHGAGVAIWFLATVPAFLLSYRAGLRAGILAIGIALALCVGTEALVARSGAARPDWPLLISNLVAAIAVAGGVVALAERFHRDRRAAEDLAFIDPLLRIANRRYADMALEQEIAAAVRGSKLSVVLFDLDRFKSVNDVHGHAAGDRVLKAFARVLKTNTRRENLAARFGGEEFIAIIRDADAKAASVYASRVLDALRQVSFPWGTQTVSAGVAEYMPGMRSHEVLVAAADRALYRAKESGRDHVFVDGIVLPSEPAGDARPAKRPMIVVPPPLPTRAPARVPDRAPEPTGPLLYLVDDDEAVRLVLRRVLTARGYRVWDTSCPEEAVRVLAATDAPSRPGVVLTDVIMPTMTGPRMVEQMLTTVPRLNVIYLSGFVQSETSYAAAAPGTAVAFVEKPVTAERLLAAVQRMAGAPPAAPVVAPPARAIA